jgi:outer membrane cobalamin receptor
MSIRRSLVGRAVQWALQGSLVLAVAPVAGAQEVAAHAATVSVLEEVVVTAQRREQTLQEVPITVSGRHAGP